MATGRAEILVRRPREAPDVITERHALDAVLHPTAQHHADRRQALPQPGVAQPRGAGDYMALTQLLPPPIPLLRLCHGELKPLEVGLQRRVETVLDVLVQVRLVI